MGKRRRRKVRVESEPAPDQRGRALRPDQHMARVNVSADDWRAFRMVSLLAGVSIADGLGRLVERELARQRRLASRKRQGVSSDGGPVQTTFDWIPDWEL